MATYTKRSNALWQAKARKKGYPTQSKTFSNKAMTQKWATDVEAQMNGRIFRSYKSAEQTTFKKVCERYKEEVIPLKKSSQQLTSMINNLITKFGNHTIATIMPKSLVQHRNEWLKSVSDQTVRKDLMCIRRILAVASKESDIYLPSGNPVDMITIPPQARQGRDRRLESDEEERLCNTRRMVVRKDDCGCPAELRNDFFQFFQKHWIPLFSN